MRWSPWAASGSRTEMGVLGKVYVQFNGIKGRGREDAIEQSRSD